MYNLETMPPWFLSYRETMKHKEIKWFAQCLSGPGRNNLAPANQGLLLLGGGSHPENLLPPPTALALVQPEWVGLRWDWRRFFPTRGQSPGLWDFPQKRSSKEKGLVTTASQTATQGPHSPPSPSASLGCPGQLTALFSEMSALRTRVLTPERGWPLPMSHS